MKKSIILLSVLIFSLFAKAQTDGELSVSITTSTHNGQFAPRNCVAIWVEDDQGNFVKTLLAYAQMYRFHLNNWEASTTSAGSEFNTTDAITGASMNSHGTRSCTWDGKDFNGSSMSDGTYRVCMELTESNATGRFSYFTFNKSSVEDNQSPADVPSFSDIVFDWTPSQSEIENFDISKINVLPNPTKGIVKIQADEYIGVEVWSMTGKRVMFSNSTTIDLTSQANGVYFIKIKTENGIFTRRILKD